MKSTVNLLAAALLLGSAALPVGGYASLEETTAVTEPVAQFALLQGAPDTSQTKCTLTLVICVTGIATGNPVCTKVAYHTLQCTTVATGGCHGISPGLGGKCSYDTTAKGRTEWNAREWSWSDLKYYWTGWKASDCNKWTSGISFSGGASWDVADTSGAGDTDTNSICATDVELFDAGGGCLRAKVDVSTTAKGSTLLGTVSVAPFVTPDSVTGVVDTGGLTCPS